MNTDSVFQFQRKMTSSFSGVCAGVILLAVAIATPLEASDVKITYASSQELRAMFIKRGRINYPWIARRQYRSGSGIFRVYINPDGKVRTVGVVRSTGHSDLDLAAAAGFYHSLFKPGRRRELDLPVAFTLSRRRF
jgi:TonB family protein